MFAPQRPHNSYSHLILLIIFLQSSLLIIKVAPLKINNPIDHKPHQTFYYGHRIGVVPSASYDNYNYIPPGADDCSGNALFGMYADIDSGCQGYHVCHGGRKDTFMCPQGTLFNQELLTCDFWFKVNCAGRTEGGGGSGGPGGNRTPAQPVTPTSESGEGKGKGREVEPLGGSGESEVEVSVGGTDTGYREGGGEREQPENQRPGRSPYYPANPFPSFPSFPQTPSFSHNPQPSPYPQLPPYQPPGGYDPQPPTYQPPSYQPPPPPPPPPAYQPPSYQPPSYQPPTYQPPTYQPPSYQPYVPPSWGVPSSPRLPVPSGPSYPGSYPGSYGPESEGDVPLQPPSLNPNFWTEGNPGVGGGGSDGSGGSGENPWQPEEPEWTYAWMRRFEPKRQKPLSPNYTGRTVTYHGHGRDMQQGSVTKQNFDFILANHDIFASSLNRATNDNTERSSNSDRRNGLNPSEPSPWLFPVGTNLEDS